MKYLTPVFQALLVFTLIFVTWWIGPDIESRVAPVYGKFVLTEAKQEGPDLLIRFRFNKKRNCDPSGFSFFLADRGLTPQELQISSVEGVPPPRPTGEQLSRRFLVRDVTEPQFRHAVFGVVLNRCHPLWTTRTVIYP